MCAHKVIGMSVIALTCSAVVANTLVNTGSEKSIIATLVGDTSASSCAPCVVRNYKPRAPAEEKRRHDLIVGKWVFVTATESGRERRCLAEYFDDGTFRMTFRNDESDGRASFHQNVGNWGISGPIYFTTATGSEVGGSFAAADPGNPDNYTAYAVLDIDDGHFRYESFSPRARFSAQRVGDDFGPNDL